jgi:hypothetical protein
MDANWGTAEAAATGVSSVAGESAETQFVLPTAAHDWGDVTSRHVLPASALLIISHLPDSRFFR